MRVTAAFFCLLRLSGVWVKKVRFEPGLVVVAAAGSAAGCAALSALLDDGSREKQHTTRSGGTRISGVWHLEVHARPATLALRRARALVEGAPFVRDGARFTRDFETSSRAWRPTPDDNHEADADRLKTVGRII